jgi:O-acetyl-ADP-ribose deacetylase (regulator of RNase III)
MSRPIIRVNVGEVVWTINNVHRENLLDNPNAHPVFFHGYNCRQSEGSGVAKRLFEAFPELKAADRNLKNSTRRLGNISYVDVINQENESVTLCNLYSQDRYGNRRLKLFDLEAFEACLEKLKSLFSNQNVHFFFPAVGCGSGGATWAEVSEIIVRVLGDFPLTFIREFRHHSN